jgi:hypothetical protein
MRRIVLLACVIFSTIALTAAADPPITLMDQMQAVIDSTVGGLAIGGESDQRLAQTVTAGIDGRLTALMLPIACESGRLVVEIRDVIGGEPGPTVLSRGTFPATRIPNLGPTFQMVPIRGSVNLTAGDQFAIVLDNPSGSCGIFRGPVGDSYPGGQGLFEALPNPPGWIPFSETEDRLDLPFITVVRTR